MGGETLPDLLSDPTAVHLNMLRGGIAKPSPVNIWHLYGRALLEAMPQEYRAAALDDGWRPPAGWKLVPEKATEAMILAAQRITGPDAYILAPWQAMLAAAPPPPDRSEG